MANLTREELFLAKRGIGLSSIYTDSRFDFKKDVYDNIENILDNTSTSDVTSPNSHTSSHLYKLFNKTKSTLSSLIERTKNYLSNHYQFSYPN